MASEAFFGGRIVDFHDHLLYPTNISSLCDACDNSKERVGGEGGYMCRPCGFYVHKDCVEITNPSRHKHPLKHLAFNYLLDHGKKCYICRQQATPLFYHCFVCDMTFCQRCPSRQWFLGERKVDFHKHSEGFLDGMKVDFHDHLVYPTHISILCDACDNSEGRFGGEGGYICKPCDLYVHKDCVEITNTSRHKHPLKLLVFNYLLDMGKKCYHCGQRVRQLFYHCFLCDITFCKHCLSGQLFLGERRVDFHKHLLYPTNISSLCDACDNSKERVGGEGGYTCRPCHFYVHKVCAEINNPSRHKHPLKLCEINNQFDMGKTCYLCGEEVRRLFYHCSPCDLNFCRLCPSKPLFIVDIPKKIHEHSLTQMMIKVSFTCDACGICGDGLPCVCLKCCFIIHKDCIKLPRVIHINRHDHRVSHAYSLGPGDWICGVCRKGINILYGAYSCSRCTYATHSKCSIREDVWDGVELEDVPEYDNEDLAPFVVIEEGVIKYFSHEHPLTSFIDGNYENRYCYACTQPIYCDPCYSCMQCRFILHQTCGNLLKKKRHEISNRQLTLHDSPPVRQKERDYNDVFDSFMKGNLQFTLYDDITFSCGACKRRCTGFCYENEDVRIDVRCAQVSQTFNHGSHPHPLFSILTVPKQCRGCGKSDKQVMSCTECDFDLCYYCATLPKEVRHKYDRHPLSLCYGENAEVLYWCEICEGKKDPKEWFYTCNECGSTLHVDCVLGEYLHVRPGHSFIVKRSERKVVQARRKEFEVVANDRPTRPFCSTCRNRCVQPFFLEE